MSDANPYTAPDAVLQTGDEVLYQPRLLSFRGRIGRMRYLAYNFGTTLLLMLMVSFLAGVDAFMGGNAGSSVFGSIASILFILIYIVMIVLSIGFARRRFNDLDRSGWWLLTFLIPLINVLASIYLVFFPGTDGANKFGPAPKANSVGVLILGWVFPLLFIVGIVAAIAIPAYQNYLIQAQ